MIHPRRPLSLDPQISQFRELAPVVLGLESIFTLGVSGGGTTSPAEPSRRSALTHFMGLERGQRDRRPYSYLADCCFGHMKWQPMVVHAVGS